MKVIYCICLIIFAIINLSVQKLKVVGNCTHNKYIIESLKDQCLQIKCLGTHKFKGKSCRLSGKPCSDDGALEVQPGSKEEKYPYCCPTEQCVY